MQFRSASRLGQVDFDVHKLRYNQFVRMLSTYGGWEVAPLEKSRYLTTLPFRGTQYMLDKTSEGVERITDRIIQKLVYSSNDDALNGATARYAEELQRQLAPYYHALIDPVLEQTNSILLQSKEYLPFIDQGLQQIEEFEQTFEDKMDSFMDR